jgi:hypothetical protein
LNKQRQDLGITAVPSFSTLADKDRSGNACVSTDVNSFATNFRDHNLMMCIPYKNRLWQVMRTVVAIGCLLS